MRITAGVELASQDASGQTSSTNTAETGIKPKTLNVSAMLPFTDENILSQLFSMAESLTDGARTVYRITNATASAIGVKQVRFNGRLEATEQESTRQWAISFQLQEYRSVPQKTEERLPQTAAVEQGGSSEQFQWSRIHENLQQELS